MPPSLTDLTACPGPHLLSCERLANPAVIVDVLILNVHKTPPELYNVKKAWVKTVVRPLPSN
jgi:hypothetical protein